MKRSRIKAPRGRQGPYTAGVHRFGVQGLEPSSVELKAGARSQHTRGLAAPEEDRDKEERMAAAAGPEPLPQACVCLAEGQRRGRGGPDPAQTAPGPLALSLGVTDL